MKITKTRLRQIIREALGEVVFEGIYRDTQGLAARYGTQKQAEDAEDRQRAWQRKGTSRALSKIGKYFKRIEEFKLWQQH